MGNDDKIKNLPAAPGSSFLPDEIRDVDGKIEVYSLEDEFAKTKKNKSYRLYITIFLFTAIIGFLTYAFTNYLVQKDKDVPIDIKEFEDLRLKEVLQSANISEARIEMVSMRIQAIRIEMLNDILDIRKKSLSQELDVTAMNIPQAEKEVKLKAIREKEAQNLRWGRARYNGKILREKRKLWALETEIRKNRASIKKKKAEGYVTNEDRLNNLKMEKLKDSRTRGMKGVRDYYESYMRYLTLRYNPIFRSSRLKAIVAEKGSDKTDPIPNIAAYRALLKEKSGFNESRFNALRKNIEDDLLLVQRLRSIPNINSVAPSIRAIDALTKNIVKEYEVLWGSLSRSLEGYQYAMQHHLKASNVAQGIILDGRNLKLILFEIQAGQIVRPGDAATVVRGQGKKQAYVGTLEFYYKDGLLRGKMEAPKLKPEPFDMLVLVDQKR